MSEQRPDRQQGSSGNGGGSGGGKKNGRAPVTNSGMRLGRGFFGWFLFIALAVMLFMLLNKNSTSYATIPLSEFVSRLKADKVSNLTIDGDKITGEFRETEIIGGDK